VGVLLAPETHPRRRALPVPCCPARSKSCCMCSGRYGVQCMDGVMRQVSTNIDYISIMPAAVNTSLGYTAIYGAAPCAVPLQACWRGACWLPGSPLSQPRAGAEASLLPALKRAWRSALPCHGSLAAHGSLAVQRKGSRTVAAVKWLSARPQTPTRYLRSRGWSVGQAARSCSPPSRTT